jgi:hypothetical protein
MTALITFFPVGNGDMTLIELESGRTTLIDVNIRAAADNPDDPTPDVAAKLRHKLKRDAQGRLYVDVFVLSHPDKDHCTGLSKHFHLGPPDAHAGEKILIRELWSSPMLFRRASSTLTLCDDAKAFNTEARRRVQRFRDVGFAVGDGDRIQILGKDENGKTDDLTAILVEVHGLVTKVNGMHDGTMEARLLGPPPQSDDEDDEEALSKNRASVILRFSLTGGGVPDVCRFLTGGDAEVAVWERLWEEHSQKDWLEYDILQTPHHCSWHSLSYESWSELGEDAQVSQDARSALSQARRGAVIVASSKPIKEDDADPPCIRAKREYARIAQEVSGAFKCTGEYPSEEDPDLMEFEIGGNGPRLKSKLVGAPAVLGRGAVGAQPLSHG